jgi:predicted dehydrogenase
LVRLGALMADRLRAGIVGAGFMGEVHARAVRAAGGVVARVAASTPERSAAAAARLGAEGTADSAEALLAAEDVDVVHVCTPNALHVPVAEGALAAGKAVVCEKPLATTVEDARRLTTTAKRAALVATVPFVYRFYPSVREARARIAAGQAGRLRLLHGTYLQDWLSKQEDSNWRVDPTLGGASRAFGDIGVHWCDLMEFVTGQRIVRLTARTVTAVPKRRLTDGVAKVGTEDAATVLFETGQGASGAVVISQVSPGRKNRLWFSFDGAEACFSFDQENPDSLWIGGRASNQILMRGAEGMSEAAARYSVLPAGHPQGYQDCFNAFVADSYAAIAGAQPDGLPTFADGLRAATLTQAVVDSAIGQTWVEVPQ